MMRDKFISLKLIQEEVEISFEIISPPPLGLIYLIEINPRGGGDMISNDLISLSTDYDYLKQLLLVALDEYIPIPVHNVAFAGIYYLSAYTIRLLPYFESPQEEWMVKRERINQTLTNSCGNYDRDGFILYCSDKKISI